MTELPIGFTGDERIVAAIQKSKDEEGVKRRQQRVKGALKGKKDKEAAAAADGAPRKGVCQLKGNITGTVGYLSFVDPLKKILCFFCDHIQHTEPGLKLRHLVVCACCSMRFAYAFQY